jgi:hypothetical protein
VIGYGCFDVHWISFVFLELSLVCFRRDSDKICLRLGLECGLLLQEVRASLIERCTS